MRRKNISPDLPRVKHIPQRTCISCRQVKAKRELIRLVRTSVGSIEVDATGKKPGRGAYLCFNEECWQSVLGGGRLEHALAITITPKSKEELLSQGKDLLRGGS